MCGIDCRWPGKLSSGSYCEHSDEPSGSIKARNFLTNLVTLQVVVLLVLFLKSSVWVFRQVTCFKILYLRHNPSKKELVLNVFS
jgi:hypothetical protein